MAQMDAPPFANPTNTQVLNAIRGISSADYQSRVPVATKASTQESFNSMWDYQPARNEFIQGLVNVIGSQIIRYNTWNNPLKAYKRGLLNYGETIEEVAVGLLNAYHYSHDRDYLEKDIFGREPNEVQSRFHKINREDYYKLTIKRNVLQRAFYNEGGVSQMLTALMAQVSTSDQWDEFLLMSRLFKQYYDRSGFYTIATPDLTLPTTSNADAKQFLKQARALADTLPFISRDYNASKMPVAAQPGELMLITTPEAQANIDVEALSAAFQVDKANISSRTTILPSKYIGITGFQALLTTKDFFVCADNLMEMQNSNNPVALHTNFFWHHWETISASPFVPAILFSSTDAATSITLTSTPVNGISTLTLIDGNGNTVTNAARDNIVVVQGSTTNTGTGALNTGLTLSFDVKPQSTRTRITQTGVLYVAPDEKSTNLIVRATATDDRTVFKTLTIPITGPLVTGSIGQYVDDDTTTLTNRRQPVINPTSGAFGTVFTVNNGTWDQEPDSFTYQWQKGTTNISGATADTYTSLTGDGTIRCIVTAVKAGFTSVNATSKTVTVTG